MEVKVLSQRVCILLVGLAMSACSPYAYKTEIDGFATSVEGVTEHMGKLLEQSERFEENLYRENLAEKEPEFNFVKTNVLCRSDILEASESLTLDSKESYAVLRAKIKNCKDYPSTLSNSPKPKKYTNIPALGKSLNAYVESLRAITNAEDKKELESAVGELSGAVSSLASEIDEHNGDDSTFSEKFKEQASALEKVINMGSGMYFDHKRYKALKASVNEAGPFVDKAAAIYFDVALITYQNKISDSYSNLKDTIKENNKKIGNLSGSGESRESEYLKIYDSTQSHFNAYTDLISADPFSIYKEFRRAHKKLVDAILSNDVDDLKESIEAIKDFKKEVKKAREALDEIDKKY